MDFFDFDYNQYRGEKILTLGNPPFGKNASLAQKFFNRSAIYSDAIAFLIPRTFRKASMINRLNRNFHCIFDETVPENQFVFEYKPYDDWVGMIRDSKQMSPSQREYVIPYLESAALALEIGVSSSIEVDNLGIVPATRLAMKRAINSLTFLPQYLLLDAFPLPDISIPQKAIIRGDSICFSIASASIVAKVRRDKMMEEYDILYPGYGFVSNKGYGTRQHMDGLKELGPSPIHRKTFSPLKEMLGF